MRNATCWYIFALLAAFSLLEIEDRSRTSALAGGSQAGPRHPQVVSLLPPDRPPPRPPVVQAPRPPLRPPFQVPGAHRPWNPQMGGRRRTYRDPIPHRVPPRYFYTTPRVRRIPAGILHHQGRVLRDHFRISKKPPNWYQTQDRKITTTLPCASSHLPRKVDKKDHYKKTTISLPHN
ncbi:hypothetical protein MTO96_028886 [Rhipicephalus appendiculatus]